MGQPGGLVAKLPWNSLWHQWRRVRITTLAAHVISGSSAHSGCKSLKRIPEKCSPSCLVLSGLVSVLTTVEDNLMVKKKEKEKKRIND